jgi:hypothetical protein
MTEYQISSFSERRATHTAPPEIALALLADRTMQLQSSELPEVFA